jgi:hypothetical protein
MGRRQVTVDPRRLGACTLVHHERGPARQFPGEGVILLAAGRLVVVPTGAPPTPADVIAIDGPHQPIEGDVAAYCGYFVQ